MRNGGSGGEGWRSARVADLVGRNAAVRGGWQEEEQRMSLVWETIIWRSLLDMGLSSGFISKVFHSQINLSFPTNGRRIHLRKGWQGLQEPLDGAKHLVRVARLLLYCCVFSLSTSSGRGGLSSEESVCEAAASQPAPHEGWMRTLTHTCIPQQWCSVHQWLSPSLSPFRLRIPGMRLCCGMRLFSACGWRLSSYKHI